MDNVRIAEFDFRTYEQWLKRERDVTVTLGVFFARISEVVWYSDGRFRVSAGFGPNGNPLNVYANPFFIMSADFTKDDKENGYLEHWYNEACETLNEKFAEHVAGNYLVSGRQQRPDQNGKEGI